MLLSRTDASLNVLRSLYLHDLAAARLVSGASEGMHGTSKEKSMATRSLVEHWQRHFDGRLLAPDHDQYPQSCRIWNGMIDRRPALIARCLSPADVAAAVKLARAEGLPVSIRGGGHGVAGTAVCDDGLMIDLSLMKSILQLWFTAVCLTNGCFILAGNRRLPFLLLFSFSSL